MKTFFVFLRRLVPASVVLGAASTFAAVEEQVVGTLSTATQTVVSDHGGHIALVARKGSRMVVAVDGVAGPKFDAIVTPSVNWIDPRPRQAAVATGPLDRHGHNQPAVMPVIFNADGSHFAYVGKVGQEWVVMQDQAEVARMPEAAGREVRLQFTESGKHLLFAVSSYDGFTLWVDGKAWPGFYATTGTGTSSSEPLISPDGEHIAYPAHYPQNSGKQPVLVVDGRELNYYAEKLMFTPDSKHLIAQAQTPKGIAVLIDGKSLFTARTVYSVTQAPAGLHIAAVLDHEYPDHSRGQFVVLDQKPVEATLCKNSVEDFTFSPDGQHWAVVCSNAPGHFYVVHDGKKESEYDMITNPGAPGTGHGLIFSPDSSRLVYVAHGAGKYFVVINGEESDQAFDAAGRVQFSSDGKRLAYSGFESGQNNTTIVIDGKVERLDRGNLDGFDFSPDGSRYAYLGLGPNGAPVYADGQPTGITATNYVFSPDGKHLAIAGYRATDNVAGLWVDGEFVYKGERAPAHFAFSTDNQHLFWVVLEPAKGPNAIPGTYELVTYADGKACAHCDNAGASYSMMKPSGYSDFTIHPGWQVIGDNKLVCLGPTGDEIKRYTITAEGNVATLIADAHTAAEAAKAKKKR